jgi:hypothetical protein
VRQDGVLMAIDADEKSFEERGEGEGDDGDGDGGEDGPEEEGVPLP